MTRLIVLFSLFAATVCGQLLITNPSGGGGSASQDPINLMADGLPAGTVGQQTEKNLVITTTSTDAILDEVSGSGYVSEIFVATNRYDTDIIITVDGTVITPTDFELADFFGHRYADTQAAAFNRWISVSNFGSGNVGGLFKLPIPFSETIKIELQNDAGTSATITSHVIYHTGITDSRIIGQTLRMGVVNVGSIAADAETDMLNVSPSKAGRLAGVAWIYDGFPGSVNQIDRPLEGAFKVYIDGSATANYATAGAEDFFGMPWYFARTSAFGAANTQTMAPASSDISLTVLTASTWGAMRFFALDPIEFTTGLRVSWTCGNTAAFSFTGTCTLIGTVYYYQDN